MIKYIFAFITYLLIYIGHEKDNIKYDYLAGVSILITATFLMIEIVKELNQ